MIFTGTTGKPILLFDMDDVIADLQEDWITLYNAEYNANLLRSDILSWDMTNFVKPECGKDIYRLLTFPGLYKNLKPMAHSQEVLKKFHRDFELFIVSHPPRGHAFGEIFSEQLGPSNPSDDKKAWLHKYFPFIPESNVIFTESKHMVMGSLLLDDAPHNLINFAATGRTAVCFDQPWNQDLPSHIHRVHDFKEMERLTYELFDEYLKK